MGPFRSGINKPFLDLDDTPKMQNRFGAGLMLSDIVPFLRLFYQI